MTFTPTSLASRLKVAAKSFFLMPNVFDLIFSLSTCRKPCGYVLCQKRSPPKCSSDRWVYGHLASECRSDNPGKVTISAERCSHRCTAMLSLAMLRNAAAIGAVRREVAKCSALTPSHRIYEMHETASLRSWYMPC